MTSEREHPIDPELAAAVRQLAELRERPGTDPGERLAYLAGELEGEEREAFEDRMAWDPETAASVRRLARFDDSAEKEVLTARLDRSVEDEAADWQTIQERLAAPVEAASVETASAETAPVETIPVETTQPSGDSAPVPIARRSARSAPGASPLWRLAVAALLLAVVGLGAQVVRLQQRVAGLEGPQTDLGIVTLRPAETTVTREGNGAPEVTVVPGGRLVIVLSYTGFEPFERHGVLLTQPPGEVLWSNLELTRSPDGSFLLELPGDWLAERGDPDRIFELQLVGLSEERQTPLAQYLLRIDRALRGQDTPQH